MKLLKEFDDLLRDKVNLNDTRLRLLDERVTAVSTVLKADPTIGSYVKDTIKQGSWAHRTIIRPGAGLEFDADFLLRMEEVPDWHEKPVEYLKQVRAILADHGTYKSSPLRRKHRCVRLGYSGDCHLDIVPFVRRIDGTCWIVNGDDDVWERTDPEGFTGWIKERDTATGGNLRKTVRLLKFLRDRQGVFGGTKSVILTTLVGDRVQLWRPVTDPGYYSDVPTTLVRLVEALDDLLWPSLARPSVPDPSSAGGTFDHRWSDDSYGALRADVHAYSTAMREALDTSGTAASRAAWREIFGGGFPEPMTGAATSAGVGAAGPFGAVPAAPGRSGRAG